MAALVCRKRSLWEDPLDLAGLPPAPSKKFRHLSPLRPSPPQPPSSVVSPAGLFRWVALLVKEMAGASSVEDAESRASGILQDLEKFVEARVAAEAAKASQEETLKLKEEIQGLAMEKARYQEEGARVVEEAMKLKQQVEGLIRDNGILKRAVAIQNGRQKEYEEKQQEVNSLRELLSQYEVKNYTLSMHLKQALQGSSVLGSFRRDVF